MTSNKTKNRVLELEQNILKARMDYYNNQPKVSDKVFDAWVDELKTLDPTNKAITSIGAPVASAWEKAKHQIPMGSLDKVNTPAEFAKWAKEYSSNSTLFITEKLDGLSIEVIYENGKFVEAITRGDGETGEKIGQNVIKMNGVQKKLDVDFTGSLRGEIILRKSNHQNYFPEFANPRNAASGVSKRLNGIGSEYLDVLFYQALGDIDFKTEQEQFRWLEKRGLGVPNWKASKTKADDKVISEVNAFWKEYQTKVRETLDYDIDGLVIRVNDLAQQLAFGEKDLRPKAAIAFKFENEARETTITAIDWQVGNSGRLTPVAHVDPVMLVGAEIKKASIYNYTYITDLGLDVGAKVLIVRANDVIPRIEELVLGTGSTHEPPSKCPKCSSKVVFIGENLTCTNRETCPAQIVGRIKNWVSELNILELGDTLIEKLVDKELVFYVSDLYTLTVDQLADLDRMGEKSAKNVYNSLWSHNPVPLELFLGGLSIPMIGSSTIKLIMEAGHDNLDAILKLSQSDIENIKGIGPIKAQSLYQGLKDNKDIIQALQDNGLKIKDKIIGKLTGKSLCFTGTMTNKRAVLEQMVVDSGGTVKSSVGKGLSYLVINDVNSTSSKAVAARKLGTVLVSEDDFLKMV